MVSHRATVRNRVEDGVAIVTIDNPPVNALSPNVLDELEAIFDELAGDSSVKGVVITGGGRDAFSAGADLNVFSTMSIGDAIDIVNTGQKVFNKIERFERPVIAAINGVASGGGNELALACDIRISSDRARYSQPEVNLGLIPAWGGTRRLAALVGKARAKELIFTGHVIMAQEAYRIGLVNKVVPDGEELRAATDLIRQISLRAAPLAVRAAKRAIDRASIGSAENSSQPETEAMRELAGTEDLNEGISAFLQKRLPKFQGK